jgi:diaminohydroxyphosphoribosylaminopyrimidine deaminase/5-amino-6-(5-phosphoribosylamino)uracil reductase
LLRAQHDAILVGIGTVLADNPALTCRLPGLERRSPIRVVADSHLRTPLTSELVSTARERPTILFTTKAGGGDAYLAQGVEIERVPPDEHGRVDVVGLLRRLGQRGITRVLAEGGPALHASLLWRNLADVAHIYHAPLLIGEGGKPAIASFGRSELSTAPYLKLIERVRLGPDLLESFALTV